jgi:hypothetical protein
MGIRDIFHSVAGQREEGRREEGRREERRSSSAPTFSELLAARQEIGTQEGKRRFDALVARFCKEHGPVDDVYWAATNDAAVALTVRRRPLRWLGHRTARLHRVSDNATAKVPEVAGAIEDWEVLAVRAQMLRGQSSHFCMQWIFAGIVHLIATVAAAPDRKPTDEATAQVLARHRRAMRNVNAYYLVNATRGAHLDYFAGMMLGALVNGGLAIGFVFFLRYAAPWLWDIHVSPRDQAFAFGCVAAGAIGSILSVVLRMTVGRFATDYEAGRSRLWVIGSFRPFIGAVSGLALYFAVRGNFVTIKDNQNRFVVLAFLAFLAGFSERFARDTFMSAENVLAPMAAAAHPPSGGATTDAAAGDQPLPSSGQAAAAEARAGAEAAAAEAKRDADRARAAADAAGSPPAESEP